MIPSTQQLLDFTGHTVVVTGASQGIGAGIARRFAEAGANVVNAVSPGLIARPGIEEHWPEGVARWQNKAPLGRMGEPEDVADAYLFLASPAARWITAQDLVLDGGVLSSMIY
jgi:NAD(P)-dependent dehydrogenase (short-subunit alcohol dehydrogenase family)